MNSSGKNNNFPANRSESRVKRIGIHPAEPPPAPCLSIVRSALPPFRKMRMVSREGPSHPSWADGYLIHNCNKSPNPLVFTEQRLSYH